MAAAIDLNPRTLLRLPGVREDRRTGAALIPLPGDGGEAGLLRALTLAPGFWIFDIDIHSTRIPRFTFKAADTPSLTVNHCFCGRCEVALHSGETTYLSGGELVVDNGKSTGGFHYPEADYEGIELAIRLDGDWQRAFLVLGESFAAPRQLFERCESVDAPRIYLADVPLARTAKVLRDYLTQGKSRQLIAVKIMEWLLLLAERETALVEAGKIYYPKTQVEIAKAVQQIIVSDLQVRHPAAELAARFGISASSLKNYFCNVYGCGYAVYQRTQRMKRAAKLLSGTRERVADIAASVGYASQTKFGSMFKKVYGVSPLTYRKQERLRLMKQSVTAEGLAEKGEHSLEE